MLEGLGRENEFGVVLQKSLLGVEYARPEKKRKTLAKTRRRERRQENASPVEVEVFAFRRPSRYAERVGDSLLMSKYRKEDPMTRFHAFDR